MRESTVESAVCLHARNHGILATKLSGPNERGRPDRMFLHQGKAVFIEFKAPGKKPTVLQMKWLMDLRDRGFAARWVDNVADGVKFLNKELLNTKSHPKEMDLASLVDGAYNVVELYKTESPAQVEWKKNWLEKARKLVPGCDSLWL